MWLGGSSRTSLAVRQPRIITRTKKVGCEAGRMGFPVSDRRLQLLKSPPSFGAGDIDHVAQLREAELGWVEPADSQIS